MSVLIKGMEMPKKGEYKPLYIYDTGEVTMEIRGEEVQVATAVPVPPHGDLIDRDPFIDFIKTHWDSYDQWFVDQLEARPTVIPADTAEGGE